MKVKTVKMNVLITATSEASMQRAMGHVREANLRMHVEHYDLIDGKRESYRVIARMKE